MFCPECRTEYRKGFTTCADCEIPLVSQLPPEPPPDPDPVYIKYVNLYSPRNEVELALLKSILESEHISFFVRNDNFGSLEVGPQVGLYNGKMIQVEDDKYERAGELLSDYLGTIEAKTTKSERKYSAPDIFRMLMEFILFGWIMPGKMSHKQHD